MSNARGRLILVGMGLFASHIQQIIQQDESDRAKRIERAWVAYYGRKVPDTLTIKPGQADDNVHVNKARVVVDKGVSFLFGEQIAFKLDEQTEEAAQVWLDACWAANHLMTWLHKLALNGGVCGHVFVKIVPATAPDAFPRLVSLDPGLMTPIWDPQDIETVVEYIYAYNALDPVSRKPRNYRQTTKQQGSGWVIIDEESEPDGVWHLTGTTLWPHPYPPIIDCQNLPIPNEFWGFSDIEDDILDMNQAASFTISNGQRIVRYHGHPKTITTGVQGDIDVDVDGVIQIPNPDAKMWNLEMQSELQSTVAIYEKICDAIHEVSRVPSVSTGTLNNLGQLSGVALEILYQPLIEKTRTKRNLYGDLLVELCRRLLDLQGYGATNVATITWPKLLPTDPLQERQADLILDQMGIISKQTLAERLGLDWETERARMKQEDADELARQQAMVPVGPSVADPMGVHSLPLAPRVQGRVDTNGDSLA